MVSHCKVLRGPVHELPSHISNNMRREDHLFIKLVERFVGKRYPTGASKKLSPYLVIAQYTSPAHRATRREKFRIWSEDTQDTLTVGHVRKHMQKIRSLLPKGTLDFSVGAPRRHEQQLEARDLIHLDLLAVRGGL